MIITQLSNLVADLSIDTTQGHDDVSSSNRQTGALPSHHPK